MANNSYFNAFQIGKVDDDQNDLPLLPLQSKFSVTSQMNPVRGLEMKRLISVNQGGTAEPLIDLGNQGYINYFSNAPGLGNQQSFILDFNNQQSNINLFNNQNYSTNMMNDVYMQNNQSFMDNNNIQNQLSNAIQGNQRQNQNYYGQNTQQNFFVNPNGENSNNQNQNLLQQQIQNQNQNNANLMFKNPDQFNSQTGNVNNNMKYTGTTQANNQNNGTHYGGNHINNQYNYQGGNMQNYQQQVGNIYSGIQEKKEEGDDVQGGYDQGQASRNQYYGQQTQGIQQPHPVIHFQNLAHQEYINRDEVDYIPEHKSQHGDDSNNQQGGQDYQGDGDDDDDRYQSNNESHTRNKTEWPTRPKGQIKYQQCRHRNIFKNFGNIFRKFVSFHNHFTDKALANLNNNQETLKNFQRWLKKEIRLENKKDFIEGWTIWKDEDQLIRQFKIILKELSRDFFQDYILIYLLNSKLQDLEIHLRSIGPCLAAINQPSILYKFRPI